MCPRIRPPSTLRAEVCYFFSRDVSCLLIGFYSTSADWRRLQRAYYELHPDAQRAGSTDGSAWSLFGGHENGSLKDVEVCFVLYFIWIVHVFQRLLGFFLWLRQLCLRRRKLRWPRKSLFRLMPLVVPAILEEDSGWCHWSELFALPCSYDFWTKLNVSTTRMLVRQLDRARFRRTWVYVES